MSQSREFVLKSDVVEHFSNVVEKLYDSVELQIRGTTLSSKQFTDSADILINQTLPQAPLDTYATSPTTTVGVQFPAPRDIFLPKPLPGRCSANTLAGTRCRGECFAPFTLCSTHWRYFRAHRFLPPGGAPEPGMPHPDDVWMHAPPTDYAIIALDSGAP